jgi:choline dehydrogenase-like flavoprotein
MWGWDNVTVTLNILIVGSGPAAAGAALALAGRGCAITVVDMGRGLEPGPAATLARVASVEPDQWSDADARLLYAGPVPSPEGGLPEKRVLGSDYPFRNIGQLDGVTSSGVHGALISGAYGGFSSVWGAQILPFPRSAFDDWPRAAADLAPHYRAVLSCIPFAGQHDDLAESLPLYAPAEPLPPLSPRAELILRAHDRHRERLRGMGMLLGRSRLAVRASDCRQVGLCMSGCPYSLIYSAGHTFDELRRRGDVTYYGGLLATSLSEDGAGATVTARELRSGATREFKADRVLVACGAVGTTRLVMSSLGRFGEEVLLAESAQFVVPLASRHPTQDPRQLPHHTLGQISAVLPWDDFRDDPAHLQVYTYNPAFRDAMPPPLRKEPAATQLLRRLSVALGYLPSSVSPRLRVRLERGTSSGVHPIHISCDDSHLTRAALRGVVRRMIRAAPLLDLWPVLPRVALAAPGKSYHWGGSFPYATGRPSGLQTDLLGRLPDWRRIHLVDASVFPSIAATTFTLTEMANAHRTAAAILHLEG